MSVATVGELWQRYRDMVLEDYPEQAIEALRRAFYSGVYAGLSIMKADMDLIRIEVLEAMPPLQAEQSEEGEPS